MVTIDESSDNFPPIPLSDYGSAGADFGANFRDDGTLLHLHMETKSHAPSHHWHVIPKWPQGSKDPMSITPNTQIDILQIYEEVWLGEARLDLASLGQCNDHIT